jgi:hypothetical protein
MRGGGGFNARALSTENIELIMLIIVQEIKKCNKTTRKSAQNATKTGRIGSEEDAIDLVVTRAQKMQQ